MKRRLISYLLVIGMIASMVPVSVFAETTPEDVAAAIDQAQVSEGIAAAGAVVSGEVQTAQDEVIAIANQQLAEEKLEDAQNVVEGANAANAEQKETAEQAAQAAGDAADAAEGQQAAAAGAADKAEEALDDAQNAQNKQQATQAADKAEAQSDAAAKAAAEAVVQSQTAAQKAEEAKAAYDAAKAAADAADAEAKELLAAGLINAEEAQKKAEEAAAAANQKYEELCAAQKAAEEAAAAAKTEADAAKEELKAAAEELENVIAENAANVAEKAETAAVTGGALVAAKLATEVAEKVVDYYEGEIEDLQAQVDELDAVIAEAENEIAKAEEELAALNAEDAEYATALRELEAAQAAKDEAQKVKDNAQAIIDAKAEAEEAGTADTMKDLQSKVNDGTATDEEKQQLTELVLGNIKTYDDEAYGFNTDEIEWVNDNIFSVGEGEDKQYYEVQTVEREDGTKYLQYFKTEPKNETVDKLPDAKEIYPDGETAGKETTVYRAYDKDGNAYEVIVECTSITIPFVGTTYSYTYKVGSNLLVYNPIDGQYYVGTQKVTIVDTSKVYYDTQDDPMGTNSNSITDKWEDAANAEQNLTEKTEALNQASAKYEEAKKEYDAAVAELEEIIETNAVIKYNSQAKVDALNAQITELDKKLNGGAGDQLLRALIEGDTDAGTKAAARIAELMLKSVWPGLTEEEQKELDELKGAQGTSEKMLEVIKGAADGKIDLEDAKNIVALLADNTLSAKTRLSIARAIEKVFQNQFDKAAEELKEAIAQAEEEIAEQADVVDAAAKNVAQKELALADALLKEKAAEKAASNAEGLKELADKAAKDAQDAYNAYKWLVDAYATDKQAVADAKAAYESAQAKADEAAKAAADAAAEAERARIAAEEARKIADSFPVPQEAEVKKLAARSMTIAEYAYSLRGLKQSDFASNVDGKFTNATFVEFVFARFGYRIDLSSNKVEDVVKNGIRVDSANVKPSDIVCILAADGATVECFGVYYGDDVYVFYNETSEKVETGKCAEAGSDWFAVRVAG